MLFNAVEINQHKRINTALISENIGIPGLRLAMDDPSINYKREIVSHFYLGLRVGFTPPAFLLLL